MSLVAWAGAARCPGEVGTALLGRDVLAGANGEAGAGGHAGRIG